MSSSLCSAHPQEMHMALYVPSEELGNNCVCFSTRAGCYTFLRVENGKLKFVNAPLS